MLRRYEAAQRTLLDALTEVERQMKALEAPTNAQLYRLDRYQTMLKQVADEMARMGIHMADTLPGVANHAKDVAIASSEELVRLQSNNAAIVGAFNRMDVQGVKRAAAFVSPGSPLMTMLQSNYGNSWADVIAAQYVTGVALGQSPRTIVAGLKQTVTTAAPADLTRIIRTAQVTAYRQTNTAAWQQSGVVESWTWSATLDDTTCASCWAQNGTIHPISEVMDDHHNGRCAPVPQVSSDADYQADPLNIPTGESVFNSYTDSRQAEIAKAGGWGAQYRAYKDGAITFGDMTRDSHDDIYGNMKTVASLKALLGDTASKYYK
jgi:SPP1 gp7 family putative phage head morphogenesis protein